MTNEDLANGLPLDADLMLGEPPAPPFDWVREGTSLWFFEENGKFGIPRIGVEAEPWTWENRRFNANFAFADGRVMQDDGTGPMAPVRDASGRPAVMGGGPMTFRCIEPFRRWHVSFEGSMIATHVERQIANAVLPDERLPLRYELELEMVAPANVQDISPAKFATWGKGKRRDAVSVGLGWRFEQCLLGQGEIWVDGKHQTFRGQGSRVKRRSVRTDGLFLRGHVWQCAVFPDGRAFGFEVRPVHDDGFEPWNEGFVYVDGRMHAAKVHYPKWLGAVIPGGEDVSFELHSDLGVTRIKGTTGLSTFRVSTTKLFGLNLHQGGALYEWGGQKAWGMIERSMPTDLTKKLD